MKSLLALFCLLAFISPLQAADDQMSNWLVGKWITSFNQPFTKEGAQRLQNPLSTPVMDNMR